MQIRFRSNPATTFLLLAGVLALITGCGKKSNLTAVSGEVKSKGVLITEGNIMFYPVAGGRPAMGMIGEDGRYELTSKKKNDGVPPGSYKVTITANKEAAGKNARPAPTSIEEETAAFAVAIKTVWLIPPKYSELTTTTLTAEVEKGKANVINFDSADFK